MTLHHDPRAYLECRKDGGFMNLHYNPGGYHGEGGEEGASAILLTLDQNDAFRRKFPIYFFSNFHYFCSCKYQKKEEQGKLNYKLQENIYIIAKAKMTISKKCH